MTNEFIKYLKESSDCLYIYNRNFSIYGLSDSERYTIVVNDNWVCPEDWIGFDPQIYQIYTLSDWFKKVLDGELIGWECSCLNKKYIIKEHVKLMMIPNILKLRTDIENLYKFTSEISETIDVETCYIIIRNIKFAMQIIENHKIINYKDGLRELAKLQKCESVTEMWDIVNDSYLDLLSLTDGVKKQELLKKAKIKNDRNL